MTGKLLTLLLVLTGPALWSLTASASCQGSVEAPVANAGCMVIADQRLLVVRDRKSGRLGFPGGTSKPPEDARCTAERETLEETGLQVRAGTLLTRLGNDFHLYHCEPLLEQVLPLKPPVSAWLEIETLDWVDPHAVEASQWRFPEQLSRVRQLFERLIQQSVQ